MKLFNGKVVVRATLTIAIMLLLVRPLQAQTGIKVDRLIDSLTLVLNKHYILPDKAEMISDSLYYNLAQNKYSSIKDAASLAYQLTSDMRKTHRDYHLTITYAPELIKKSEGRQEPSRKDIKEHLNRLRNVNFDFQKLEILPGNIGYIKFNSFPRLAAAIKPTITSAFRFLENSQELIIDLRDNHGGDPRTVRIIESFFFKKRTLIDAMVYRNKRDTSFLYTEPSFAGNLTLAVPVWVLTSGNTFSGGEDFAYSMQSSKRAAVVGATTAGGAHPAEMFHIGQGFLAIIPNAKFVNPYTKTNWEGVGVKADVSTSADEALIKAYETIRQKHRGDTGSQVDQQKIDYEINTVKLQHGPGYVYAAPFEKFVGTYKGGIEFYLENKLLYCKNGDRGNHISQLKPISKNLFALDENAQVEFVENREGSFSKVRLLFFNGHAVEMVKVGD